MTVRETHRYLGLLSLWTDERGAVAVLTGILLTVLIGIVGLAIDAGVWYQTSRALQNAADAAVIAAAHDGTDAYASQAKAVTAQYGFVDGSNGITVTALNNQTCPSPSTATDCYKVTVAQSSAPLFFSAVIGLSAPALSGAAMASSSATHNYCLLALASSGTSPAIDGNGASKANMNGCSVMSNTGATCSGHDLGATYGDAHGTNDGCGVTRHSNAPVVADPYSSLASNIPVPSPACPSYPQEPKHGTYSGHKNCTGTFPTTGAVTLPATTIVGGDVQLTGDVIVTSSAGLAGSVLVIENGVLDTNGHKLSTASGSALTIIFSGTSGSYNHYPTDNTNLGTLDFMAPTSGTWKGIAIHQDPSLTSGIDFTYAGNNPTWNITGVAYFPHASLAFKGAVNKSAFGASCLLLVADNIKLSGTASIEATTTASCAPAGVTLPTNNVGGIALLM
jgi:Flp pilus assembly protein TadG